MFLIENECKTPRDCTLLMAISMTIASHPLVNNSSLDNEITYMKKYELHKNHSNPSSLLEKKFIGNYPIKMDARKIIFV